MPALGIASVGTHLLTGALLFLSGRHYVAVWQVSREREKAMNEKIPAKSVKARKCCDCGGKIVIGERYYIYCQSSRRPWPPCWPQCLKCDESETFIALKVTEVMVALEHLPAISK